MAGRALAAKMFYSEVPHAWMNIAPYQIFSPMHPPRRVG
jgi:hypothetical protein